MSPNIFSIPREGLEVTPDPRPKKRWRNQESMRRKLAHDPCCRVCPQRATEAHHIVLRSQGGDDYQANIMPLCRQHHHEYHNNSRLVARVRREEELYVLRKLGIGRGPQYLRQHYGHVVTDEIDYTGEESERHSN